MSDFATAPLSKEFIEIDGKKMAFHQTGEGRPVVFLHGIPLPPICGETLSQLFQDMPDALRQT